MVRFCLDVVRDHDPQAAWQILDEKYQRYNWIHAYPNIAADILALWHCGGDMTEAFSLLALAGLDVDCNAGLVGNVLGILTGVPPRWAEPIEKDDLLETCLPATPRLSIRALAERTYRAALSIL